MTSQHRRVRGSAVLWAVAVLAVLGQACGSSSNSDSGSNGGGTGTTPSSGATFTPRPTSTRTVATPAVTQPSQNGTPTPSPTEVPTEVPATPAQITVFAGGSIAAAAKRVPDGGIVVVAPGSYRAVVLNPGDLQGSVTIFADVTGEFTDSAAAPVTIVAGSEDEAAFKASSQVDLAIDGFTLRGGRNAGFFCADCTGISVLDCTVTGSDGDAVRFEASQDALVFNNLLTGNKGAGVKGLGTTNLQIVNNTIYRNGANGIALLVQNQRASTDGYLRNNILDQNTPTGILVDRGPPSSLDGFDGDFDLNNGGYNGTAAGAHDIATDPLFIFPSGGDFRVAPGSPVIDAGTDSIDPDLVSALEELTTQTDGSFDTAQPDLGYHYIPPIPTPTRAPKPTRTPTPKSTNTPTP